MNFASSPSPQAPIAIGARLDAKTTMIWPILPPALIHTGVSNTMPHLDLDKTDIKILAALQQNGRLTNVELADAVALSPSPCLRRLKHLEESGIIKRYVALLDPARLGLGLQAFVNVALEKRGSVHMQSFLQAVQPRWAVVSVGADNSFGHPHTEVLQRLAAVGARLLRTDVHGAIVFYTNGENLRVEKFVEKE